MLKDGYSCLHALLTFWQLEDPSGDVLGPAAGESQKLCKKNLSGSVEMQKLFQIINHWSHQNEVRDPESGVTA